MQCPTCETDLISSHRHDVAVNYCPECRGVWLERGELDKVIEAAGRETPEDPHTLSERRREHHLGGQSDPPRRRLVEDIFNLP